MTFNFDESTEVLTKRLIDRVPIIKLKIQNLMIFQVDLKFPPISNFLMNQVVDTALANIKEKGRPALMSQFDPIIGTWEKCIGTETSTRVSKNLLFFQLFEDANLENDIGSEYVLTLF